MLLQEAADREQSALKSRRAKSGKNASAKKAALKKPKAKAKGRSKKLVVLKRAAAVTAAESGADGAELDDILDEAADLLGEAVLPGKPKAKLRPLSKKRLLAFQNPVKAASLEWSADNISLNATGRVLVKSKINDMRITHDNSVAETDRIMIGSTGECNPAMTGKAARHCSAILA